MSTKLDCPRCKSSLVKRTIKEVQHSIEVDHCDDCGGTWFDESELESIEHVSKPTVWEIRRIPRSIDQLAGLYCPTCEDHPLMAKAEHDRDQKVILDFCDSCKGIWLDKGELEAIQEENWITTIVELSSRILRQ